MDNLINQFKNKSWFHSIGKDQFGRYVVYINAMSAEVMEVVPSNFDNKQVLAHFASSLKDYKNVISLSQFASSKEQPEEESMEDIIWSLRRECGTDNLVEILYEIHEKSVKSPVSKDYPEVRDDLEDLYEEFGFDALFKEIDLG